MGSGLPGDVRGVLAGARQRILGRHLRRHRLPAGARCVAAQGLVPHGRHRHRCDRGGGAQRPVSAEPRRLPARSCTVGRRLRLGRDAVAQLRVLRRRHVRFHRGDHRRQRTWRGRGHQRRCLQPRCRARCRDMHRHRVRRRCPGQHRPRRRAPAAGDVARQPVGRCRRWPDARTTVAGLHAGRVTDGAPATGHAGLRPQHSDRPGGRRDLEHAVPPACHPGRGRQPVRRTGRLALGRQPSGIPPRSRRGSTTSAGMPADHSDDLGRGDRSGALAERSPGDARRDADSGTPAGGIAGGDGVAAIALRQHGRGAARAQPRRDRRGEGRPPGADSRGCGALHGCVCRI